MMISALATSPNKMLERLEISTESLNSTIPLLPDLLDQGLSSLLGGEDTGMEVLRRVMMSSDSLLDDATGLSSAFRPEACMDYESDCTQEATENPEMYKAHLRTFTDPILHDNRRLGDDIYDGAEVRMYTELTGSHYREFSPGSTGDSSLEQDLSSDVGSSSESGFESPTPEVRWETIAECPSVVIPMDPDMQLPPVNDFLTYRSPKDDYFGLSSRRHTDTVLIKTELPDSDEDSCLSAHPYLHSFSQHYPLCLTVNNNNTNTSSSSSTANATTTAAADSSINSGSCSTRDNDSCCSGDRETMTTSETIDDNKDLASAIARKVKAAAREKAPRKKPGRKKGQVSKVLHLWEFIRDLLSDPHTCPRIINWENETEGVFRVLHSSEVARLWGEKKKNKRTMTYEKLSRSLRYSRKEGYFDSLPKDKGYPKKLCFKFGPKSHGWKDCTC